jgi:hypothetical protein
MLWPTTYGAGPFYPCIAFDDVLYRLEVPYDNENSAYAHAHKVYTEARAEFVRILLGADFTEFRSR